MLVECIVGAGQSEWRASGGAMRKLRFLVSLTTNDNDYQIEQAQSAEQAVSYTHLTLPTICSV